MDTVTHFFGHEVPICGRHATRDQYRNDRRALRLCERDMRRVANVNRPDYHWQTAGNELHALATKHVELSKVVTPPVDRVSATANYRWASLRHRLRNAAFAKVHRERCARELVELAAIAPDMPRAALAMATIAITWGGQSARQALGLEKAA